jgi:hypothetical protein
MPLFVRRNVSGICNVLLSGVKFTQICETSKKIMRSSITRSVCEMDLSDSKKEQKLRELQEIENIAIISSHL